MQMNIVSVNIHKPFIVTIPDECAPFLILEQGSKPFNKFVMENYINFHAYDYQNNVSDGFLSTPVKKYTLTAGDPTA